VYYYDMNRHTGTLIPYMISAALLFVVSTSLNAAGLVLGPEQIVQAGGADLWVTGFSVPSFVHWDDDGLKDLVVGDGSGIAGYGRVRIYLNRGAPGSPEFTDYFYAQSNGSDLQSAGGG
jgi:hypothetical protein